jgi:archaellum component FlaD/FlaE
VSHRSTSRLATQKERLTSWAPGAPSVRAQIKWTSALGENPHLLNDDELRALENEEAAEEAAAAAAVAAEKERKAMNLEDKVGHRDEVEKEEGGEEEQEEQQQRHGIEKEKKDGRDASSSSSSTKSGDKEEDGADAADDGTSKSPSFRAPTHDLDGDVLTKAVLCKLDALTWLLTHPGLQDYVNRSDEGGGIMAGVSAASFMID